MNIFPRPAESSVKRLLAESDLPVADLTPRLMEHFLGCGSAEVLTGVVGLEIFGPVALLRSLAVAGNHRGSGLGKALVAAAEGYARSRGVEELYLLTTTADRFFERLGYERADREAAPESIRGTSEFSGLCPSSSVFMLRRLPADPALNPDAPPLPARRLA